MCAQVESVLQPHKIGALRYGSTIPGTGPGRSNRHLLGSPARQRVAQQPLGHRASTSVAGADEEDVHYQKIISGFLAAFTVPTFPLLAAARREESHPLEPAAAWWMCSRPAWRVVRCPAHHHPTPGARRSA